MDLENNSNRRIVYPWRWVSSGRISCRHRFPLQLCHLRILYGPRHGRHIALGIIYSALYAAYLDRPELIRRTGGSLGVVAFIAITFLAYRAGYLRHPKGG